MTLMWAIKVRMADTGFGHRWWFMHRDVTMPFGVQAREKLRGALLFLTEGCAKRYMQDRWGYELPDFIGYELVSV